MARPSKLSADQRREVERRLAGGEGVRALAREFGVGPATIIRGMPVQTERLRNIAEQVASAQSLLATLPAAQQNTVLSLAAKLRGISDNLASAASYGAATAHRLNALANVAAQKIDDENPMETQEVLQTVSALTKMANEAAITPMGLLSANRQAVERINAEKPPEPAIDATRLSNGTLQELLDARAGP